MEEVWREMRTLLARRQQRKNGIYLAVSKFD